MFLNCTTGTYTRSRFFFGFPLRPYKFKAKRESYVLSLFTYVC